MLICTLRSTVAFFFLFFTLDLAFLLLGIGYLQAVDNAPNSACIKAGGVFGILAAFAAWYNALAGILDRGNSFFLIPVAHFPWSVRSLPTLLLSTFNTLQAADTSNRTRGAKTARRHLARSPATSRATVSTRRESLSHFVTLRMISHLIFRSLSCARSSALHARASVWR